MDSSLLSGTQPQTKAEINQELWGTYHPGRQVNLDLEAYWRYYSQICVHALRDQGRWVALRTHRDVIDVARHIKAGATRPEIKDGLRSKLTTAHEKEKELLENSIDLATSLLLMVDCGSLVLGFSGKSSISWTDGSLKQHLSSYFSGDPVLAHTGVKLQKNFTALHLCRIAGLEIVWTDNLIDHLRLTEDDTKVHIFQHASFLEWQRQSQETLLPAGLADETLQTLALLFPSGDSVTRRWFYRAPESKRLDGCLSECGQLSTENRQIERFHFWRDRLVTLKQVFDEAQPKTLSQWWHDRRNGVQWYTFWVAVVVLALTVVFGFIQSVEGALQVYASFQSLSSSSPSS